MHLDKRGRNIVGYAIVTFLIGVGITAYFMLQQEEGGVSSFSHDIAQEGLREGVNQYRLGNHERARLLLLDMLQNAREKRTRSMAALYLGNIAFQSGDYGRALEFYEQSQEADKKNLFAPYNAAVTAAKLGTWKRAIGYFKKTGNLEEEFPPAALLHANLYYGAKRYGRAVELYRRTDDADDLFLYNDARALLKDGKRLQAIRLLESIAADTGAGALLRGLSARDVAVLEYGADSGKASAYMERAARVFPSSEAIQFNRGLFLVREGRYGEALPLLRALDNTGADRTVLEGYALYRIGNYGEALGVWERAYVHREDARTARILGDLYYTLGKWQEAERLYRRALRDPDHMDAFYNLAQVFIDAGELDRASEVCAEYAASAPGEPDPLICLADLSFRLERVTAAKGALGRARELGGDDEESLLRVGSVYARYGLYNSALHVYQQIVENNPGSAEAYGRIGEVYYRAGHPVRAREYLREASELAADSELSYRVSLYLALAEGGAGEAARLGELVRAYPHRYEAYYNEALAFIEEGAYEAALKTIEECLERAHSIDDTVRSRLLTVAGIAIAGTGAGSAAARFFSEARQLDEGNELAVANLELVQRDLF
jgi:tetratricopeptide (TPR) repeat protein